MESDFDLLFRTISLQNHVKEALEKQSYFRQSLVSYDIVTVLFTPSIRHQPTAIGTASANSVEFRGIRPRMYIEDLL